MEYLYLVESLVGSLAWPVATIVIVLLLKSELAELLKRVRKIKHKDSEIDLSIKEAAESATLDGFPDVQDSSEVKKKKRLAKDSPRGAILESWLDVEEAIEGYCKRKGILPGRNNSETILTIQLYNTDSNALGDGIIQMMHRLRGLRNNAVHLAEVEISETAAVEYAETAQRVIERLEEA